MKADASLDKLPDEIVDHIVRLGNRADALMWMRVAKRFDRIASPVLYKHVFLDMSKQGAGESFAEALSHSRHRMVQSFRVMCLTPASSRPELLENTESAAFVPMDDLEWTALSIPFPSMVNLHTLQIYVEPENYSDAAVLLKGLFKLESGPTFPKLRKLVIGFSSPRATPADIVPFINLHPDLRSVSIFMPPYHQHSSAANQLAPKFKSLPHLEYLAAPWDYFEALLSQNCLTVLKSATIDFGNGGHPGIQTTVTAVRNSPVADTLTTLVCTIGYNRHEILNCVSSQLRALESLSVRCQSDQGRTVGSIGFVLDRLKRMPKLKYFSLSATGSSVTTTNAALDDITDDAFSGANPALERVDLFYRSWKREVDENGGVAWRKTPL